MSNQSAESMKEEEEEEAKEEVGEEEAEERAEEEEAEEEAEEEEETEQKEEEEAARVTTLFERTESGLKCLERMPGECERSGHLPHSAIHTDAFIGNAVAEKTLQLVNAATAVAAAAQARQKSNHNAPAPGGHPQAGAQDPPDAPRRLRATAPARQGQTLSLRT